MARYEEVIFNKLTGEEALIKSNDIITFQNRKNRKLKQWEKKNKKILSDEEAAQKTDDAIKIIQEYRSVLKATLSVNDKIDWKKIKNSHKYKKPNKDNYLKRVSVYGGLEKIPFLSDIFSFIKDEKENQISKLTDEYEKDLKKYKKNVNKWKKTYTDIEKNYENFKSGGVEEYLNLVLERSSYPDNLNLIYDLRFSKSEKLLIIDIEIPTKEDFPRILEYRYVASQDEIKEKEMKEKDFEQFYNDVIYQIILRTIHEVFESDYKEGVETLVVNTKLKKINRKTGKEEEVYTSSVQVQKVEFTEIDLKNVSPEECFKYLKGITAGSLIELSPIKPIMLINRKDNRIVHADQIVDQFDSTTNLATIPWQEFEVLVRDLIKKEFSREGCQVEVTRASRDAGVDALAFDEDPIRGGKYIIQAKRYNNVVPVSAVRDLYGTVVNEGAVKGILITTSYYGKDSLEFAKDKPLKLINGEELLYMFDKFGHKFKIELENKRKRVSGKIY
jgi:restriction system protein